jgi:hypothetical protein
MAYSNPESPNANDHSDGPRRARNPWRRLLRRAAYGLMNAGQRAHDDSLKVGRVTIEQPTHTINVGYAQEQ